MKYILHSILFIIASNVYSQPLPENILQDIFQNGMVEIKAASFQMGNPTGKKTAKPVHTVKLNSYQIGKYEITQRLWHNVLGGDSTTKDYCAECAVVDKSWDSIQLFLNTLNKWIDNKGFHFRLPTEAEWEFAARAGTHTAYSFGDDPKSLGEYGWYSENSGKRTHDVASLKPNPAGLFDMHGNVWEWVSDWYAENSSGGKNTTGPENGTDRVIRGGSWNMAAENLRSARRQKDPANFSSSRIGFRLVRFPKRNKN